MIITPNSTRKFKAVMLKDDERTGYKEGRTWEPKGFYLQEKNKMVIIGDVEEDHSIRITLPADSVILEMVKRKV